MDIPTFVLASASPARRRLLETVGIHPVVCPSDFDESQVPLTDAAELVQTLAQKKAEAVAASFQSSATPTLILGCDSVLVVGGEIHGKPESAAAAITRWKMMRGQVGELYTGHALMAGVDHRTLVRCQMTQVYFAHVSDDEIAAYVATGEPLQCAGCFAIEGKGGLFIEKLVGCHTNVIGLSLPLLRQMLGEFGYAATDFWRG